MSSPDPVSVNAARADNGSGNNATRHGLRTRRRSAGKDDLEEKIGQLNQLFFITQLLKPEVLEPEIRAGRVGSLLFVTDPAR